MSELPKTKRQLLEHNHNNFYLVNLSIRDSARPQLSEKSFVNAFYQLWLVTSDKNIILNIILAPTPYSNA